LASGSKPVTEIAAEAKAAGISRQTLRRARERLRIVPKKKGYFPGAWHWELPQKGGASAQPEATSNAEDAEDAEGAHTKNGEHLRENVNTLDKNREGEHLRGDNDRNRYAEGDHAPKTETPAAMPSGPSTPASDDDDVPSWEGNL